MSRLARAKSVTKADISDFIKMKDFYNKLKSLNKKVTSNKAKHVEAENKVTDLTNKIGKISEKGYGFFVS